MVCLFKQRLVLNRSSSFASRVEQLIIEIALCLYSNVDSFIEEVDDSSSSPPLLSPVCNLNQTDSIDSYDNHVPMNVCSQNSTPIPSVDRRQRVKSNRKINRPHRYCTSDGECCPFIYHGHSKKRATQEGENSKTD